MDSEKTIKKDSFISTNTLLLISSGFIMICYSALILPDHLIHRLTSEDGLFESIGAFFFLATSIIFFSGFLRRGLPNHFLFKKLNRNYNMLIAGILFLFIFGEEISWGQRILGIESGEYFKSRNIQGETNLHNLKIFNSVDSNNVKKEWWYFLSMSRMFRLFWFVWCILIPISVRLLPNIKNTIQRIGIPLVAPAFGILLALNYVTLKFFESWRSSFAEVVEIEECVAAFIFFTIALFIVYGSDQTIKSKIRNEDAAFAD